MIEIEVGKLLIEQLEPRQGFNSTTPLVELGMTSLDRAALSMAFETSFGVIDTPETSEAFEKAITVGDLVEIAVKYGQK